MQTSLLAILLKGVMKVKTLLGKELTQRNLAHTSKQICQQDWEDLSTLKASSYLDTTIFPSSPNQNPQINSPTLINLKFKKYIRTTDPDADEKRLKTSLENPPNYFDVDVYGRLKGINDKRYKEKTTSSIDYSEEEKIKSRYSKLKHVFYKRSIKSDPIFESKEYQLYYELNNKNPAHTSYLQQPRDKQHSLTLKVINHSEKSKIVKVGTMVERYDIPKTEPYNINYELEDFIQMTVESIQNVQNVMIYNQFWQIHFSEPINLYRKSLKYCVLISKENAVILDEEWKSKRYRIKKRDYELDQSSLSENSIYRGQEQEEYSVQEGFQQ